jgi:predicted Co/Zn/Cd cation transporter (cation efflux family)
MARGGDRLCYHRPAMTLDRLRNLGFVLAFLLLGVMLFSLYGAFRSAIESGNWIAFLGGILMGAVFVTVLAIIMLVPDRRRTGWVQAITSVNTRYLFGGLLVLWVLVMGFLASLSLAATQVGGLALIGMFAGIFIFLGFVWSVIGE